VQNIDNTVASRNDSSHGEIGCNVAKINMISSSPMKMELTSKMIKRMAEVDNMNGLTVSGDRSLANPRIFLGISF
jgi:hypothetical protein